MTMYQLRHLVTGDADDCYDMSGLHIASLSLPFARTGLCWHNCSMLITVSVTMPVDVQSCS